MRISRQPSPLQIMIGEKQPENVKYFVHLGSKVSNDTPYACDIKDWILMTKASLNAVKNLFTRKMDLNLRKKCYVWSIATYGAETSTRRKVNQKFLDSSGMWCRRKMEKIGCTNRVRNE